MRFLSVTFRVLRGLTFLLLLGGIIAYTPLARRYADDHVFVAENKQAIAITSSPGEELSLGVKMPSAVSGLWAAPQGLTLQLGDKDKWQLVEPVAQSWTDSITTNRRDISDDETATGRVVVPAASAQTVLEGRITGTVVYPVGGLGTFRDEQVIVDVPVKLTVVTDAQGWTPGRQLDALIYGLIIGTGLMILFALVRIVQSLVRHGLQGAGGAFLTGAFLGGLFVGIGYVAEKAATPEVSDVDVLGGLPVTPFQLIVLMGVAVLFTIAGIVMGPDESTVEPEPVAAPA